MDPPQRGRQSNLQRQPEPALRAVSEARSLTGLLKSGALAPRNDSLARENAGLLDRIDVETGGRADYGGVSLPETGVELFTIFALQSELISS